MMVINHSNKSNYIYTPPSHVHSVAEGKESQPLYQSLSSCKRPCLFMAEDQHRMVKLLYRLKPLYSRLILSLNIKNHTSDAECTEVVSARPVHKHCILPWDSVALLNTVHLCWTNQCGQAYLGVHKHLWFGELR